MAKTAIRLASVIALIVLGVFAFAGAHPANIASAKLKVAPDGKFELRVRFDLLAFLLETPPDQTLDAAMNALLNGTDDNLSAALQAGDSNFRAGLRISTDTGACQLDAYHFPTLSELRELARANSKQRLPVMMSVVASGQLASGARKTWATYPETLGMVIMTTEMPYTEPFSEPVPPGSTSSPFGIPSRKEIETVRQQVNRHQATTRPPAPTSPVKPAPPRSIDPVRAGAAERAPVSITPRVPPTAPTVSVTRVVAFGRFMSMGFRHIVPEGLDHILFVLGLFLLSTKFRDLAKQITAFTVAHSLTLALSLYGVIQLPSRIVEPLIALSIVFVAVENILTTELKPWRIYIVFGFGLVHGLGFASALRDLGLAHGQFLSALVGFNLGVECGQLAVVALAFCLVGWFRHAKTYRPYVVLPGSCLIAAVAAFWTIQRLR